MLLLELGELVTILGQMRLLLLKENPMVALNVVRMDISQENVLKVKIDLEDVSNVERRATELQTVPTSLFQER